MQFVFALTYLAFACIDLLVAKLSIKTETQAGRMLCFCMIRAALVGILYPISILETDPIIAIGANILCLCISDIMIVYLLCFFLCLVYKKLSDNKFAIGVVRVFMALSVVDIISLLTNPIFGHVATYELISPTSIPHFLFQPGIGYIAHLALCYVMLIFGFVVLIYNALKIPHIYRSPILRVVFCVSLIFVFNLIYVLFFSANTADISLLTYSVLGYLVYLNAFVYGNREALERTARTVLDSSTQPTVIFDYKGDHFMSNQAAKELFSESTKNEDALNFKNFTLMLNLNASPTQDDQRFYWSPKDQTGYSYICDYHELKDEKGSQVAKFYSFTNSALSVDRLTGFLTEEYFKSNQEMLLGFGEKPIHLAVCDLNQLSLLNNILGYNKGDAAILLLAEAMKRRFSQKSLFVRLQDAKLAAICYSQSYDEIKKILEEINDDLSQVTDFNMRLKMDYSICELQENETLASAAIHATSILKTRKLLDSESRHSNGIESLKAMLKECDGETESHVNRTRILGDSLAFELGLSDFERDQLSLLCLFHDIGKIGIPSNILNKPGKLNDAERAIMEDHVQKGYRIARATAGLEIVAEPILHHHECWDGSGYPDHLQHEAIPILSRIIAVVDAFDAMVSDRPYHQGVSITDACNELKRCAGTQFDPYIVDAFVRIVSNNKIDLSSEKIVSDPTEQCKTNDSEPQTEIIPAKVSMVAEVNFATYLVDNDMKIFGIDRSFEKMTGYTEYDVQELNLSQNDLIFDEDREEYWKLLEELLKTDKVTYLEHRIRCKDGTGRYVYCTGFRDECEPGARMRIVITDITDSFSMQQQVSIARNRAMMSLRRLEETIQRDPMTGLLNQSAFRKACERELINTNNRCVLVMIDIDNFKGYNDTYGHPKGDELLIQIANVLSTATWADDITGRLGGDEFGCLLRYSAESSLSEIKDNVADFWDRINEQRLAQNVPTLLSGGAALASQNEVDFGALYKRADDAMYRSKDAGLGNLEFD